jgi:energy-coupling factor transporter transmembrane protein EcfT
MMIRDVIAAGNCPEPSKLDVMNPGARMAASILAALAISPLRTPQGLLAGSLLPLLLCFMDGRDGIRSSLRTLADINKVSLLACFLLPLTYPGERVFHIVSVPGVYMALTITWKLNLISIVFIRLSAAMGMKGIGEALGVLRVPLKMRMLLLLTARYILLLSDGMAAMLRAVRQRSPKPGFMLSLRVMACLTGTTLIHSMDRAERSLKAIQCRGGAGGFLPGEPVPFTRFDALSLVPMALYLLLVQAIDFLWK